jgi:hypothetical protein
VSGGVAVSEGARVSFDARMQAARAAEAAVLARFRALPGWLAFPFGQGQLPDDCRDVLRQIEDACGRPLLIRWMPDIIAVCPSRPFAALIDAKKANDTTDNLAIECDAIAVATIYADHFFTPTFFVFDSGAVLTPRQATQRGWLGPAPRNGVGSGTPYMLIEKRYARPFEHVFAPVTERTS